MSPLKLKDSYDVIIIGAGIGGLTAGALLSKSGLSVCIVEKEPHVGVILQVSERFYLIQLFTGSINTITRVLLPGCLMFWEATIPEYIPEAYPRYKGNTFDYLLTTNPNQLRIN